jgi:hypothetical protein
MVRCCRGNYEGEEEEGMDEISVLEIYDEGTIDRSGCPGGEVNDRSDCSGTEVNGRASRRDSFREGTLLPFLCVLLPSILLLLPSLLLLRASVLQACSYASTRGVLCPLVKNSLEWSPGWWCLG